MSLMYCLSYGSCVGPAKRLWLHVNGHCFWGASAWHAWLQCQDKTRLVGSYRWAQALRATPGFSSPRSLLRRDAASEPAAGMEAAGGGHRPDAIA